MTFLFNAFEIDSTAVLPVVDVHRGTNRRSNDAEERSILQYLDRLGKIGLALQRGFEPQIKCCSSG